MQQKEKHTYLAVTLIGVLIAGITVWYVILFPIHTLRVSFLDVGEGRAILIQSPTGKSILIDGGFDHSVLRSLGNILGPLDRSLNLVIETNSLSGNAGGLSSVIDRYRVGAFLGPSTSNNTTASRMVAVSVGKKTHIAHLVPARGMRIDIGGGATLSVLFPDRSVLNVSANTASTVLRLSYGHTAFLFPSDSPVPVQEWLSKLNATTTLSSDVLAVGHHGSKNSIDSVWLAKVRPAYVVISVGKNSYGYPATTTVRELSVGGTVIKTTQNKGTVTFVSDGKVVTVK